jgi:hypothetical protein
MEVLAGERRSSFLEKVTSELELGLKRINRSILG